MKRIAGALLVLTLGFATACSRHFVIERDAGPPDGVDSERSIASSSDDQWTVLREPAPGDDEER